MTFASRHIGPDPDQAAQGWIVGAKPPISTPFRPRIRFPDISICVISALVRCDRFAAVGDRPMVGQRTLTPSI